jgi:hypothetical protein
MLRKNYCTIPFGFMLNTSLRAFIGAVIISGAMFVDAHANDVAGASNTTKAQEAGPISMIRTWAFPGKYTGECPKKIVFYGLIELTQPAVITYHWERSDGAKSKPVVLDLSKAIIGQKGNGISINTKTGASFPFPYPQSEWRLGGAGKTTSVTETFVVETGNQKLKVTAPNVELNCDAGDRG